MRNTRFSNDNIKPGMYLRLDIYLRSDRLQYLFFQKKYKVEATPATSTYLFNKVLRYTDLTYSRYLFFHAKY